MKLYHLSKKNLNNKTLKPRVPDNYMTKNGYEDNETPRVSLSKSIDGCLLAMSSNLENTKYYVHVAVGEYKTKIISNVDVPDQSITEEVWVISDVVLKNIGQIHISTVIDTPIQYKYGDNKKAELYKWNWKWISKASNIIKENTSTNHNIKDINFLLNIKNKI